MLRQLQHRIARSYFEALRPVGSRQTMVNLPETYQTGQYFIHDGRLDKLVILVLSFKSLMILIESTFKEMGYRGVILFPQAVTLRKEHTVAESNVSCQSLLTI